MSSLHQFFGRGGKLQGAHAGYEYRPGQIEMAQEVATALSERRHLFIEAGTGTGKTLAYLLPVLQSGRRVLLSTGTKNLQEQLVAKDVPLLAAALGRELRVVNMKGRQNYACKHKVLGLEQQPTLLAFEELDEYRRIREWIGMSPAGDQAELSFLPESSRLWQHVNARRETCTGSKCPLYDQCFLTLLRQRAMDADLVVVNHHLFFADLKLKQQELAGVLPPYEAVVFDEAHELESVASQYFGVAVSGAQIDDLARDIEHTLRATERATPDLGRRSDRLRTGCQQLMARIAAQEGRRPFDRRQEWRNDNTDAYDEAMQAIAHMHSGLEALSDKPEEIHTLMRRLAELRSKLAYLVESEEQEVVYWVERQGKRVSLQASPLDVSSLLRDMLFAATDTVVMTSATLAVAGDFAYLRGRLGADHARERVLDSPFRYAEQGLLYLAEHLPPPTDAAFVPQAVDVIEAILEASNGRAFVLCTSIQQMKRLHQELEPRLRFPLLLQGEAPRHALLERFRATPGAVLFATSSFWQGVDVQGEQLSCVIIDRLPFASPGDPVVEARIRSLRAAGGNPFQEFQVPEAVLALKQGVGRLIRSSRDRGVVALLDSRLAHKSYGKTFLASLPEFAQTNQLDDVRTFFAGSARLRQARQ